TYQYGSTTDRTAGVFSATDNAGVANTYTQEGYGYDSGSDQGAMRFSAPVGNATGLTTVSVQWTGGFGVNFTSILVEQWRNSGGALSGTVITGPPAVNKQASPGTGTDAITSGTTTPAVDGALIHGSLVYSSGTPTTSAAGTGFSLSVDRFAAVQ